MNKKLFFLIGVFVLLNCLGSESKAISPCNKEVIIKWIPGTEIDYGEIYPEGEGLTTPVDINKPRAITLDSKGNIYIGDSVNCRVLKFNQEGKLLLKYSLQKPVKTKKPPFGHVIKDITVDKFDNVYVINLYEYRIEIYSPAGNFLKSIDYLKDKLGDKDTEKSGIGYEPNHVSVDFKGNIHVYDELNLRKPVGGVYSPDGRLLKKGVSVGLDPKKAREFAQTFVGSSKYVLGIEIVSAKKDKKMRVKIS